MRKRRKISDNEVKIVMSLLHKGVEGENEFAEQLVNCHVIPVNDDETILEFLLSSHTPTATVSYGKNVPVEAAALDEDGCRIDILLHTKFGRLHELEYVRADGNAIKRWPKAEDLYDFSVIY